MGLSIVVAIAANGVIGRRGALPWRLSADLQHFRSITMGKAIIMGRLTHESIGRPLPGRSNIVISSDRQYRAKGCLVIHDLDEIMPRSTDEELMVIGGARLYAQTLPLANRLFLTEVHANVDGDVCFPEFEMNEWQEISRESFSADAKNEFDFSFVVLDRLTS